MKLIDTTIREVKLIEPQVIGDERGFFMEVWHAEKFANMGLDVTFLQDNHSRSAKNILRGLHYQIRHPQGKLVRCTAGKIFDVAVDLRRSSPTFSQWVGVSLSAENKRQLWIPEGFAHGFLATTQNVEVIYKCTAFYNSDYDRSIAWDAAELNIDWPLDGAQPVLSDKDATAPGLRDAELFD